jgi:hypothetical protein
MLYAGGPNNHGFFIGLIRRFDMVAADMFTRADVYGKAQTGLYLELEAGLDECLVVLAQVLPPDIGAEACGWLAGPQGVLDISSPHGCRKWSRVPGFRAS